MASFPAALADLAERVLDASGSYAPVLDDFNQLRRELAAVESILGINPQGAQSTVAARLATIAATAGSPGPAGAQGPAGPAGAAGAQGPAGSAGAGSSPIFDTDISANALQGNGWSRFHTCPPVTVPQGVVLDYSFFVNGGSGYTNKPFQVLLTTDDVAPSNNRANGEIAGVQPNYAWDYFQCRYLSRFVQSGTYSLRMWGRFVEYDPTVASYNAAQGSSFTVMKAAGTFGMFRGVLVGY